MITTIRCSSLGLAALCPQSVKVDGIVQKGDPRLANAGNAVHEVLANDRAGRESNVIEIATRWDVDLSELLPIVANGRATWEFIAASFPDPQPEVELRSEIEPGLELVGHADVLSVDRPGDLVLVADYKSGFLDLDHRDQLRGYAWLALRQFGTSKAYTAVLLIRHRRDVDGQFWSRAELDAWASGFFSRLTKEDHFNAGAHCRFCPRFITCPATEANLRTAYQSLAGDFSSLAYLEGEERAKVLAEILDHSDLVKSFMDRVRQLIKADIAVRGPVETADGRRISLRTVDAKEILPRESWDILNTELDDQIWDVLSVSKTDVEKAIGAKAPYRGKGRAIKRVMLALEEAGAIRVNSFQRLETKRIYGDQNGNSTAAATGEAISFSGEKSHTGRPGPDQ